MRSQRMPHQTTHIDDDFCEVGSGQSQVLQSETWHVGSELGRWLCVVCHRAGSCNTSHHLRQSGDRLMAMVHRSSRCTANFVHCALKSHHYHIYRCHLHYGDKCVYSTLPHQSCKTVHFSLHHSTPHDLFDQRGRVTCLVHCSYTQIHGVG